MNLGELAIPSVEFLVCQYQGALKMCCSYSTSALYQAHMYFFSFNFSHTSKCKSVQASVQWILIRYTKGKKFKRHTTSLQQLLWRVITDLRRHVRVCVCCYVELSSKAGKYLLASFFALLLLPLVLVKIRSRGSLTKNQTYCSGIPPLRPCLEVRSEKHKI